MSNLCATAMSIFHNQPMLLELDATDSVFVVSHVARHVDIHNVLNMMPKPSRHCTCVEMCTDSTILNSSSNSRRFVLVSKVSLSS